MVAFRNYVRHFHLLRIWFFHNGKFLNFFLMNFFIRKFVLFLIHKILGITKVPKLRKFSWKFQNFLENLKFPSRIFLKNFKCFREILNKKIQFFFLKKSGKIKKTWKSRKNSRFKIFPENFKFSLQHFRTQPLWILRMILSILRVFIQYKFLPPKYIFFKKIHSFLSFSSLCFPQF